MSRRSNRLRGADDEVGGRFSSDDETADAAPVVNGDADADEAAANAMRDLTPEETEKLVQFQDIAGLDDILMCRNLLETHRWDLEVAIRQHLDIPPMRSQQPEARPGTSSSSPPPPPPARRPPVAAAAPAPRNGHWLSWPLYVVTLPITLTGRIVQAFYSFLAPLFGLPPDLYQLLGLGGGGRPRRAVQSGDGAADVRAFLRDFELGYGARRPPFHAGTYKQALEEARRDLRFLLVYLHSPAHQDTSRFCADTLCSDELAGFLDAHRCLIWGCSVATGEGQRVSEAVREQTYPSLAVVVLRQGRMMIVGRVEGRVEPGPLVERLEAIVLDNEAYVVAARAERHEREATQNLRAEQDAAFQETLRQDQEKERLKREAAEAVALREAEERRLVEAEAERKDRIRRRKIDLADRVPDEPAADAADSVRMIIKLPGGQRLERRFLKTHSIKYLYYYVFCHPDSPDEFDVTTNFPKKVLPCRPPGEDFDADGPDPPTFAEVGLGQSTMLFVNDLEA